MEKLILVFRDSTNTVDNYELKWNILNTSLASHWLELLKKNFFDSTHPIEKTFCLKGWYNDWYDSKGRNLTYLCSQLNKHISKVNQGMKEHGYPFIDLNFTVESIKSKKFRSLMNDIHHHFEILIGQSWNVSKWYDQADADTRFSIRMLNNYCHEIETIVDGLADKKYRILFPFADIHQPMGINVGLSCPDFHGMYFYNKAVAEITLEEYNDFQDHHHWGDIRIYYAQLGKSHLEAFNDNDHHIERDNISGHRYLTGEFCVTFPGYGKKYSLSKKFKKWLQKHNFDISDKRLGIGHPIVANIDLPASVKMKDVASELRKRDDLYQIRLETDQGDVLAIRNFNYFWKDQETD
jgi:hypothetical protein